MKIDLDSVTFEGPTAARDEMKLWVGLTEGQRVGSNEARGLRLAESGNPSDDFESIEPHETGFWLTLRRAPDEINPQKAYAWLQTLVNRANGIAQEHSQRVAELREGGARLVHKLNMFGGD